jgi:hypothetical protein
VAAYTERPQAFPSKYLLALQRQIHGSRHFRKNHLNRDFVGTKGLSVVFHRTARARVLAEFPTFEPYLELALRADCNAFYLNPLQLEQGSRVDPHIDRSLRAYCPEIDPPIAVSVLYVAVPPSLRGGALVLQRGKRHVGRITPVANLLVQFDGDLTHSIERLDCQGTRLSLVCEQYQLTPEELAQVPEYAIESRSARY